MYSELFGSCAFFNQSDEGLRHFLTTYDFNPNALWTDDDPTLHFLLANEAYDDFKRLLELIPHKINPNLCDGSQFGKKSLLILLSMLPFRDDLIIRFIDLYKDTLVFDYQDLKGKTALHYAVILGRTRVVSYLLDHGASLDVYDSDGCRPADYVQCRSEKIRSVLEMIDIAPNRDLNAESNKLEFIDGQPVFFQGAPCIQHKDVIKILIENLPPLFLHIRGNSNGSWADFRGDGSPATRTVLKEILAQIELCYRVNVKDIFVQKPISIEEKNAFIAQLHALYGRYAGKSVLQHCHEQHHGLKDFFAHLSVVKESVHLSRP